jgi:hypothetical protein
VVGVAVAVLLEGCAMGVKFPAANLVDACDLGDAKPFEAVGFVPGALQFVRRGSFGKVEERPGDGRDGDAIVDRGFVGGELATMHLDPRAPSRPNLPPSRCVDVDLRPVPRQSPERPPSRTVLPSFGGHIHP